MALMDRNDAKRIIEDLKEKPFILAKDHIETASGFIITANNTTEQKKQTKADRIRAMSNEELAEFLYHFDECKHCENNSFPTCRKCRPDDCYEGVAEWLKSEVKE